MRNTPLLRPGGGILTESSRSTRVIGFLTAPAAQFVLNVLSVRHLDDVEESFWPGISHFWAPNVASAVLTNSSRSLLSICVDSAAEHVNSRSGLTSKNANADYLFLHFAVITVALHGWRSTDTRSILTADWVHRKEIVRVLIGLLLEGKTKMLNSNRYFQSDKLNKKSLKCDVFRNDAHRRVLLLEANFSQVQWTPPSQVALG